MLQYFPVDRVCSRVCSTGKFQFPLYERKQRNNSADMFGITHLIHHLTIKHVFYFICTFMMCSWTPHAEKTSTLWNHWVRRWSGACVNGSVDVWANCSDRVPVFFHSAHVVPGPRDVLICESGLFNSLWHFSYFTCCASQKTICKGCSIWRSGTWIHVFVYTDIYQKWFSTTISWFPLRVYSH